MLLIDKEFILPDYTGREADIVYRCKLNNQEVIIYMLIELQSSVDFTIPVRLLSYISEITRQEFLSYDLNTRSRADYRISPVLPIVIYNGQYKWTAKRSYNEYQAASEMLGPYIIDFRYILLSINDYSDESLFEAGDLISVIFALDKSSKKSEYLKKFEIIQKLLGKLTREEQYDLEKWLINTFSAKINDKKITDNLVNSIERFMKGEDVMSAGLLKNLEDWENQALEQGLEQGMNKANMMTALKMIRAGKSFDEIKLFIDIPDDKLTELFDKVQSE